MKSSLVLAILVAALLAACSTTGGATPSPSASVAPPTNSPATPSAESSLEPVELTVFGAASLKGVLEAAKAAYETDNPGSTIAVATDSSSALETQIEQGAPADLFFSADTTNPKKLVDGGFAAGDAVNFAGNKLTVITPTDNPAALSGPFDLGKSGVRVVAAGDEIPITKYATQLVENLAASTGAPADFAAAYAANIVSKEDNAATVRTKIELGEGDGAIVYVTDATASDKVAAIEIPDDLNVPATYAGVVVKASQNADAAQAFLDWFAGPDGQAILADFGFLPPPAP